MRSGSLPCLGALHDASGLGGQPLCVRVSPRPQSFSSGCAGDAGEQAVAIVRAPPPIGPASLAGFRVTLSKWTGLRSYLAEESSAAGRSFRPRVTSGGAGGESVSPGHAFFSTEWDALPRSLAFRCTQGFASSVWLAGPPSARPLLLVPLKHPLSWCCCRRCLVPS